MRTNWTYVRADDGKIDVGVNGETGLEALFVLPGSFTDQQVMAAIRVYDLAYARGSSESRNSLRGGISSAMEFEDVP